MDPNIPCSLSAYFSEIIGSSNKLSGGAPKWEIATQKAAMKRMPSMKSKCLLLFCKLIAFI
jgi:hypothetical protein